MLSLRQIRIECLSKSKGKRQKDTKEKEKEELAGKSKFLV